MKINILSRGQGRLSLIFPTPTSKSSKKPRATFWHMLGDFISKLSSFFRARIIFPAKKTLPKLNFQERQTFRPARVTTLCHWPAAPFEAGKANTVSPLFVLSNVLSSAPCWKSRPRFRTNDAHFRTLDRAVGAGDGIFGVWKIEPLLAGKHRESINGRGSSFASVMGSN